MVGCSILSKQDLWHHRMGCALWHVGASWKGHKTQTDVRAQQKRQPITGSVREKVLWIGTTCIFHPTGQPRCCPNMKALEHCRRPAARRLHKDADSWQTIFNLCLHLTRELSRIELSFVTHFAACVVGHCWLCFYPTFTKVHGGPGEGVNTEKPQMYPVNWVLGRTDHWLHAAGLMA